MPVVCPALLSQPVVRSPHTKYIVAGHTCAAVLCTFAQKPLPERLFHDKDSQFAEEQSQNLPASIPRPLRALVSGLHKVTACDAPLRHS